MPIADAVRLRVIFSNTQTCEPDSQGRIMINKKLRDFAGIDKNVTVIGFANHAEIWDREKYEALELEQLNQDTINAAVKELGI
jgi:MraZ protein